MPLQDFPTENDVSDPGFEELFNSLVGDAGTPADGFDDDLAIAAQLLDDLDGGLGTLAGLDGGTLVHRFAHAHLHRRGRLASDSVFHRGGAIGCLYGTCKPTARH